MIFRPAGVHPQQHLGPVLGIGATGAGIDGEHSAFLVVITTEQALQLPAVQALAQLIEALLGLGEHLLVRFQLVELQRCLGIVHGTAPVRQLLQLRFHLIQAAHLLLGRLLVIPEIRLGGELFEILLSGLQCGDVKDSPGHGPGGQ